MRLQLWLLSAASLMASPGAGAGSDSFALPSYRGDTGLFHLSTAQRLPEGRVSFLLFRDNLDRDPKDLDVSVHGFGLGIGAGPRLELFAGAGVQVRIDADALAQPGSPGEWPLVSRGWSTGRGDSWLGGKLLLLGDREGDLASLALRGSLKLPTASRQLGLGTGRPALEGQLLFSRELGRRGALHLATGMELNARPEGEALTANALLWGSGLEWRVANRLHAQVELAGRVYSGGPPDQTDPADLVLGAAWFVGKKAFVRAAVSRNLRFDDRGLGSSARSSTGFHVSVGVHPGRVRPTSQPPAAPPTQLLCAVTGFAFESAWLEAPVAGCLEKALQELARDAGLTVVLIGYAGPGEDSPADLALRRAQVVGAYLVFERGIAAGRVRATGAGEAAAAPALDPRRVEILLVRASVV